MCLIFLEIAFVYSNPQIRANRSKKPESVKMLGFGLSHNKIEKVLDHNEAYLFNNIAQKMNPKKAPKCICPFFANRWAEQVGRSKLVGGTRWRSKLAEQVALSASSLGS